VKVQGASRALADVRTTSACEKLQAFIDEVEAQSGHKIQEADAMRLIAAARQIRTELGCP
jgi:hypothetical protein